MEATAVQRVGGAVEAADQFVPVAPNSLEEAGLSDTHIEQLVLKNLYFRGEVVGRDLAKALGLRFSVIEPIIDFLRRGRFVDAKRSSGFGSVSSAWVLSEEGRIRAKEVPGIEPTSGSGARAAGPIRRCRSQAAY